MLVQDMIDVGSDPAGLDLNQLATGVRWLRNGGYASSAIGHNLLSGDLRTGFLTIANNNPNGGIVFATGSGSLWFADDFTANISNWTVGVYGGGAASVSWNAGGWLDLVVTTGGTNTQARYVPTYAVTPGKGIWVKFKAKGSVAGNAKVSMFGTSTTFIKTVALTTSWQTFVVEAALASVTESCVFLFTAPPSTAGTFSFDEVEVHIGDSFSGYGSATERMSLDASGNLGLGGIGSASAYGHGGTARVLEIRNADTATNSQAHLVLSTGATTNFGYLGTVSWAVPGSAATDKKAAYIAAALTASAASTINSALTFATNAGSGVAERARFSPAGEFLIGTTTAVQKLTVSGGGVAVGASNSYGYGIGGNLVMFGAGGSASDIYANIRVIRNLHSSDGLFIGYGNSGTTSGHLYFFANGTTERMRIDASNGFIGIGTTAPGMPLSFGTGTGNKIALYDAGSGAGYGFGIQSGLLQIFSSTSTNRVGIGYGNSGSFTETLTVKGAAVGIGNSSPGATLHVNGPVWTAVGSAAAPALDFNGTHDGLYSSAATKVDIALAGVRRFGFEAGVLRFCKSDGNSNFRWSASANGEIALVDDHNSKIVFYQYAGTYGVFGDTSAFPDIGTSHFSSRLAVQGALTLFSNDATTVSNTLLTSDTASFPSDTVRFYPKNGKLVIAYQNGGTVHYVTLALDGTTGARTWTDSTTAP